MKEVKIGTWRQNLKQRPWGWEGVWLIGLLTIAGLACFLTAPKTTFPGVVPPTVKWGHPTPTILKMPYRFAYRIFLNWASFFPGDSSLGQGDKKNQPGQLALNSSCSCPLICSLTHLCTCMTPKICDKYCFFSWPWRENQGVSCWFPGSSPRKQPINAIDHGSRKENVSLALPCLGPGFYFTLFPNPSSIWRIMLSASESPASRSACSRDQGKEMKNVHEIGKSEVSVICLYTHVCRCTCVHQHVQAKAHVHPPWLSFLRCHPHWF